VRTSLNGKLHQIHKKFDTENGFGKRNTAGEGNDWKYPEDKLGRRMIILFPSAGPPQRGELQNQRGGAAQDEVRKSRKDLGGIPWEEITSWEKNSPVRTH